MSEPIVKLGAESEGQRGALSIQTCYEDSMGNKLVEPHFLIVGTSGFFSASALEEIARRARRTAEGHRG